MVQKRKKITLKSTTYPHGNDYLLKMTTKKKKFQQRLATKKKLSTAKANSYYTFPPLYKEKGVTTIESATLKQASKHTHTQKKNCQTLFLMVVL